MCSVSNRKHCSERTPLIKAILSTVWVKEGDAHLLERATRLLLRVMAMGKWFNDTVPGADNLAVQAHIISL